MVGFTTCLYHILVDISHKLTSNRTHEEHGERCREQSARKVLTACPVNQPVAVVWVVSTHLRESWGYRRSRPYSWWDSTDCTPPHNSGAFVLKHNQHVTCGMNTHHQGSLVETKGVFSKTNVRRELLRTLFPPVTISCWRVMVLTVFKHSRSLLRIKL